jgi:hypothetical protein
MIRTNYRIQPAESTLLCMSLILKEELPDGIELLTKYRYFM